MNKRYEKSVSMYERSIKIIPLGSQTFSKSVTQYPYGVSPLFVARGKGAHVWDVDENEYVDFVNGLAAISIGYSVPEITASIVEQMQNGVTFSLPHFLEVEVAEMLVEMIPCAEMVRFGKNGTDATSAAIRLARAHTGKDHVLVCGYHGWQDWYIGSTSRDLGVPEAVKSLTHVFKYNDIESLQHCFDRYPDQISAVIMEPMNVAWPEEGFLEEVKRVTHEHGAVLIFDETITGCRFSKGGGQELFGITPDLATFGKGLANGFPLSAVVGKREIMKRMEDVFFSGTFGGETASLASAKAVLTLVKDGDVIERLSQIGRQILEGVQLRIEQYGLGDVFQIGGHPSWSILTINDKDPYSSWDIKTLFLQEMFKRGILTIGTHNISYSHTDAYVTALLNAYDEVFEIISDSINKGKLTDLLEAEPLIPLFKIR